VEDVWSSDPKAGGIIEEHHITLEERVSGDMSFKLCLTVFMRIGIGRVSICAPHPGQIPCRVSVIRSSLNLYD